MYGSWTDNVILWRNFLLGFNWHFTDFERKVDIQQHQFKWLRFENFSINDAMLESIEFLILYEFVHKLLQMSSFQ